MFHALVMMHVAMGALLGTPDVEITVLPGAGDVVRADTVAPFLVVLQNNDQDRAGRVTVTLESPYSPVKVQASKPLDLPPLSRKAVFLYVPIPESPPPLFQVTYTGARGRRVASISQQLRALPAATPVVAGLSELPLGLPPAETDTGEAIYQRAFLRPEQLPDRAAGLEMYDAIIVTPPPQVSLSTEQVIALREWVATGGTLIIDASARSDAARLETFRAMLPLDPQAQQEVTLDEIGGQVTVAGGAVQFGEVLHESGGHPLIVRGSLGLGSITCLAVSPGDPLVRRWFEQVDLWHELLADVLPRARTQGAINDASLGGQKQELAALVKEEQQAGLRLGLVLLLTVLYAIAVGPGDYYLVKWLGRPKLTWITFPAMVAVFTIAASVGARMWIGGEMASDYVQRLLILPDERTAMRYDLMSLFAPGGKDYRLQCETGAPLQAIRPSAIADTDVMVDQGDNAWIQFIPIWQRRVFGAESVTSDYPDIAVTLTRQDGVLTATITNGSNIVLRNNTISHGARSWRVPGNAIQPGASVSVQLAQGSGGVEGAGGTVAGGVWARNSADRFWAHGRRFNMAGALRRGAVLFQSDDAGTAPCPLIVDGVKRTEKGSRVIQVLTYEGQRS